MSPHELVCIPAPPPAEVALHALQITVTVIGRGGSMSGCAMRGGCTGAGAGVGRCARCSAFVLLVMRGARCGLVVVGGHLCTTRTTTTTRGTTNTATPFLSPPPPQPRSSGCPRRTTRTPVSSRCEEERQSHIHTVCFVLYAVRCVLCAVRCALYAECCVVCAVYYC